MNKPKKSPQRKLAPESNNQASPSRLQALTNGSKDGTQQPTDQGTYTEMFAFLVDDEGIQAQPDSPREAGNPPMPAFLTPAAAAPPADRAAPAAPLYGKGKGKDKW